MGVPEIAFLNGQFVPLGEARVSVNDRGFLFGDGIYEVLVGYGGRLWAVDRHWRRLARSLREVGIDGVDLEALRRLMHTAVDRAGYASPLVYLQITRGEAPRRHDWDRHELVPTILITVREARLDPARQAAGVSCITHPDLRWSRCDIKTINLLPNVMAKQKAHLAAAHEAILVRDDGTVSEGSSSAIGVVQDGTVRIHPRNQSVLPSITSDLAAELAADLGIPWLEEPVTLTALRAADEVFLCSTTSEVLGVVAVDRKPIADQQVGPVTARLGAAYREAVLAGSDTLRS